MSRPVCKHGSAYRPPARLIVPNVRFRPIADIKAAPHKSAMSSPSKAERMELRRSLGSRQVTAPHVPPYHRGADCLWPHACFECHKSWKLAEEASAKCPECGGDLHWMGRAFKVPKKTDTEQWAKARALWFAGFRFFNSPSTKSTAEQLPGRLREVDDFVRRNPEHPYRVKS